ncbi:MAG: LLM class flavin-dependent oxidoreductase [Acidimicrobiales bacterium]
MRTDRNYWVMLPPSKSAERVADAATTAEGTGMEGVFSFELATNPWASLGVAAATTSTVQLATGIALALARSPYDTAVAAMEIDRLSEGRFTLGLGSGVGSTIVDHYGMDYAHPVARMAEAIEIIRLVTTGEARSVGEFNGRFHQLDFSQVTLPKPVRPRLPIWVAALRAPMVKLAGRLADGLIGHPSWSLEWSREQVSGPFAQALAESDRSRDEVEVNLWQVVAPNADRAQSVRDAKTHVALYASIPQYLPYFDAHGFGAEAKMLVEAGGAGARADLDLVPDAMAETFVVCGTTTEVADTLGSYDDVADSICLQPPPVAGPDRKAYEARIAVVMAST